MTITGGAKTLDETQLVNVRGGRGGGVDAFGVLDEVLGDYRSATRPRERGG